MGNSRAATIWVASSIAAILVFIATIAAIGLVVALMMVFSYPILSYVNRWPSQDVMVDSGYAAIREAGQMDDLFTTVWHSVVNYEEPDTVQWHSAALFRQRYELTMFATVRVNRRSGEVTEVIEQPHFTLSELRQVSVLSNGAPSISYQRHNDFGLADWRKVVAAGGDFSAIGIRLRQNQPVINFEKYVAYPRNGIRMSTR